MKQFRGGEAVGVEKKVRAPRKASHLRLQGNDIGCHIFLVVIGRLAAALDQAFVRFFPRG